MRLYNLWYILLSYLKYWLNLKEFIRKELFVINFGNLCYFKGMLFEIKFMINIYCSYVFNKSCNILMYFLKIDLNKI